MKIKKVFRDKRKAGKGGSKAGSKSISRKIGMNIEVSRSNIKDRIDEHKQKISSEHVAKTIDKKLSKSHRIWDNVGVSIFNTDALSNISHYSTYGAGIIWIILISLVLVFPTKRSDLDIATILFNWGIMIVMFFILNLSVFGLLKAFHSRVKFRVFLSVVNSSVGISALVISLPLMLVAFAIFATMVRSQSAISMFFSLIPFYNMVVWGWAVETVAQKKGIESVIIAVISLLLILFLYLSLPAFII